MASRSSRGYRGVVGTVDAAGGRAAGRRATFGHGVRSSGGTPPAEPQPWPDANAGGSRATPAVVETYPKLEL